MCEQWCHFCNWLNLGWIRCQRIVSMLITLFFHSPPLQFWCFRSNVWPKWAWLRKCDARVNIFAHRLHLHKTAKKKKQKQKENCLCWCYIGWLIRSSPTKTPLMVMASAYCLSIKYSISDWIERILSCVKPNGHYTHSGSLSLSLSQALSQLVTHKINYFAFTYMYFW